MELLTKAAEETFDRLVRYANGRKALVTIALDKYNTGEIDDLLGFIDESLKEDASRPTTPVARPHPNTLDN